MIDNPEMIPVLQLDDIEALEAARAYLEERGYQCSLAPFEDLAVDRIQDWMNPEEGGYLLYLECSERYGDAMNALGDFFGYSGPEG